MDFVHRGHVCSCGITNSDSGSLCLTFNCVEEIVKRPMNVPEDDKGNVFKEFMTLVFYPDGAPMNTYNNKPDKELETASLLALLNTLGMEIVNDINGTYIPDRSIGTAILKLVDEFEKLQGQNARLINTSKENTKLRKENQELRELFHKITMMRDELLSSYKKTMQIDDVLRKRFNEE